MQGWEPPLACSLFYPRGDPKGPTVPDPALPVAAAKHHCSQAARLFKVLLRCVLGRRPAGSRPGPWARGARGRKRGRALGEPGASFPPRRGPRGPEARQKPEGRQRNRKHVGRAGSASGEAETRRGARSAAVRPVLEGRLPSSGGAALGAGLFAGPGLAARGAVAWSSPENRRGARAQRAREFIGSPQATFRLQGRLPRCFSQQLEC